MITLPSLFSMLLLLVMIAGCGNGKTPPHSAETVASEPGASVPTTPPAGEGHAVAGILPGSYEDWCEEHRVPETLCTRCDPSLIPAFQAANDWCGEHGLPMSQCTIHDPNLKIVRPAKPEGR